MTSLLKVGGRILGFAVLLYGAAVLLTLPLMPPETGGLDTGSVNLAIYRLEERYLVENVWSLGEPRDRIIILGASSAMMTFRPPLLQPSLPGMEIGNLGIAGANNGVARRALHLIYQAMPPEWRGHTTFVLAVSYTNFVENRFAFGGHSDNLTDELERFGLYQKNEDGIFDARFAAPMMRAAALLTRPSLVAFPYLRETVTAIVPGDLRNRLNLLLRRRTPQGDKLDDEIGRMLADLNGRSDAAYDAYVVAPALRSLLIQFYARNSGGDHVLPDEQFLELEKLAQEIEAHGDRLVIVDMPLPRWHTQGLPKHTGSYREKMAATVDRLLTKPNISYLDLRALDDPNNFADAVHPKLRVRQLLRAKLVDFLRAHADAELPRPLER